MELRQLEQFVAVAEEQHFTRAAARCGVSQSSLSATVRALERELDAPLLFRTTRRVSLTEAGVALLAEARRTLVAADAARAAVQASKGLLWGSLTVGGVFSAPLYDQPGALARFRALHPEVDLRYRTAPSVNLVADVRSGALDAAFVWVPARVRLDVDLRELATAPLSLICRADHPLAGCSSVSIAALRDETFIGAPAGVAINELVERAMGQPADEAKVPISASDPPTMLAFAAAGLGVTFLPPAYADASPELRAVPLEEPVTLTFGLATPPPDRVSAAARALVAVVDEGVR